MSQPSEPAGPPCDLCQAAPAMGSLMNYGDYSQVKFCPGCAPVFLRGIADTIETPEAGPEPVGDDTTAKEDKTGEDKDSAGDD